MTVHPDRFRQQMAWLKRLGYRGLSVRDAIPYIYGGKQGKVAVITFDDGFENVFRNALPVLEEFGFTATNYFVANQIGGFDLWDQKICLARQLHERCRVARMGRCWSRNRFSYARPCPSAGSERAGSH